MVFHWSLSDRKSLHVSRTLLGILGDLKNAVVLMVPTRPPTSKSFCPFLSIFSNCTKSIISINVTFMFHSFFFLFPSKVELFIHLLAFFNFYSVASRDSKVHNFASSLFFSVDYYKVWSRLKRSFCMSKSQRDLWVSFFRTDVGLCVYHSFVWSNLNSLHPSGSLYPTSW